MQPATPKKDAPQKDPSWNDDEEAAQKRFYIMASGGLLVVLVLAFFALKPSGDDTVAQAAPAAESTTEATPADAELAAAEAPAAPRVPGTSGGGGGGFSGGGGRPGGGGAAPKRANSVAGFTQERGVALGLSPRAAAALADSAAGHRGAAPTSGRATVSRATTLMSEPAAGTVLVTVPSGTPLSLSGCQTAAGATWCRAAHAGFSGWVRQSDIG